MRCGLATTIQSSGVALTLIPNLLTCLRILLAPLLAFLVLQQKFFPACCVVLLAGSTDWADGFLARKLKLDGRAGVVLDPAADKIMLATLFLAMTIAGLTPKWLLYLAWGRDLVIVIGALLLRSFRQVHTFAPIMSGKVSTFFQIVYLLLALLGAALPSLILQVLTRTALLLTTLFTVISGYRYIQIGIRLTRRLPA